MGFTCPWCHFKPPSGPFTICPLSECNSVCPGESWENFSWIPVSYGPASRRNLHSSWETLRELRTKLHWLRIGVSLQCFRAAALAEWIIRFSAGQLEPRSDPTWKDLMAWVRIPEDWILVNTLLGFITAHFTLPHNSFSPSVWIYLCF